MSDELRCEHCGTALGELVESEFAEGDERLCVSCHLRSSSSRYGAQGGQEARENGRGADATSEGAAARPSRSAPQATQLVELAGDAELFRSSEGEAFATIPVGGHRETWPLRSRPFRRWLAHRYYEQQARTPSAQPSQDALGVLEGRAIFEGPELPVAVRLAQDGDRIYLDLGGPSWAAVEITAGGWQVVEQPPIRFRRARGMDALPHPQAGGSLTALREVLNAPEDDDWRLMVAWLVGALRPSGPYPVLMLNGEQGAAKSTTARALRGLVDPNVAALRAEPREPRDLAIAANNAWLVALDNLSRLPTWLSDGLCRLATGGGFATRELYSDADEAIFEAQRPVIVNGIAELASRGDLLDRSLILTLPPIPERERRSERELWRRYEAMRPAVLAALLDVVVVALRELDAVELASIPRMADFAEWVVAAEPALGWRAGAFIAAYTGNRGAANEISLEASPLPLPLRRVADAGFEGSATELLAQLNEHASDQTRALDSWPKGPQALGAALTRLAPNLREVGVEVDRGREAGRRFVRIHARRSHDGDDGDDSVFAPSFSEGDGLLSAREVERIAAETGLEVVEEETA